MGSKERGRVGLREGTGNGLISMEAFTIVYS